MKQKIIVELEQSKLFNWLFDVVEIRDESGQIESCKVNGLFDCDHLEIGSWIRKVELTHKGGIKGKNKHIKFQVGLCRLG